MQRRCYLVQTHSPGRPREIRAVAFHRCFVVALKFFRTTKNAGKSARFTTANPLTGKVTEVLEEYRWERPKRRKRKRNVKANQETTEALSQEQGE